MHLKTLSFAVLVCALLFSCNPLTLRAGDHAHEHGLAPASLIKALQPARSADARPIKLPRPPKGVTELKFGEFFVKPVGPLGLEMTDKLRQLDGQRVRILGYMAQEESPEPGRFLLAPIPVQIHSHDNSLADDLPPSALHVISPSHRDQPVTYTPQLLLLTGTLHVGNRAEPGGRISVARLTLDPMPKAASGRKNVPRGKGAQALVSRQRPLTD